MAPSKLHTLVFVALVAANAGILASAQTQRINVPKSSFGAIGSQTIPLTVTARTYDNPVSIVRPAPARPDYTKSPNITMMSETWTKAFQSATNATGATGTWSINDMVKALQGTITKAAEVNQTELIEQEIAAQDKAVPFAEFAGGLFCAKGQKLANCSGVNPCDGHKCWPGSMCMVSMCGTCSASCVSYAEMGVGFNKVLGSVTGFAGPSAVSAASTPASSTPNLPVVDRLVAGIRGITNTILPPPSCGTNEYAELRTRRCKVCPDGFVAASGANVCSPCGPGTYASLVSASCKNCNPGYFSASKANTRCGACPVNSYADRPGSPACSACPEGYATKSRGQWRCIAMAA